MLLQLPLGNATCLKCNQQWAWPEGQQHWLDWLTQARIALLTWRENWRQNAAGIGQNIRWSLLIITYLVEVQRLIICHLYYGLPRWLSGKESTCQAGHMGSIPGSKDLLEKELATHSSVLAWEIPWTEEPGGLYLQGHKELDMTQ